MGFKLLETARRKLGRGLASTRGLTILNFLETILDVGVLKRTLIVNWLFRLLRSVTARVHPEFLS